MTMRTLESGVQARSAAPTPRAGPWIAIGGLGALMLAILSLTRYGAGETGVVAGLRLTARWGFLFFWASYAGGALARLFGPRFRPMSRRARAFGLAFAAVLAVHLALVVRLCQIGHAPALGTFLVFGAAVACVGLLTLASVESVGARLGRAGWWALSNIAMNYIAYAFALDFFRPRHETAARYLLAYAPFEAFLTLAPLLRIAAVVVWRR